MRARIILVTGTDTGVGKTIATAVLACAHQRAGHRVLMVKPVQTGVVAGETGDADVVGRLADCPVLELSRLPEPLAPATAARRAGVALASMDEVAGRIQSASAGVDVVLVEGAGGLLVRLDSDDGTILDLGRALLDHGYAVTVAIVARAGLGTLNHTELTTRAVQAAGFPDLWLVIGSWPAAPGLAERCNADDLPHLTGAPVIATIPDGAGALEPEEFRAAAPTWLHRGVSS